MSTDSRIYYFGFDLTRAEELFEQARTYRKAVAGRIDWRNGYSPRTLAMACCDENSQLFLTNMLCEQVSTLNQALQNGRSVTRTGIGLYKPVTAIVIADVLKRRPKGYKWETLPTHDEMLACAWGKWLERNNAYRLPPPVRLDP